MLTKRTNILFDEIMWKKLVTIAQNQNTSVGDLVRTATHKVYIDSDEMIKKDRQEAFESIKSLRQKIKHTFTAKEIKELINYGRKH